MGATATSELKVHEHFFINGQWVRPAGSGTIDVVNSTTEEVMGRIPEGTAADVDAAVAAARAAFESWSTTPVEERARYLQLIADRLAMRKEEIALLVANEVGMPLPLATAVQAGMPAGVMGSYAKLLGEFKFEEQIGNAQIVKEPIGVVGCITPWNFPLHQIVCKVAPALAAGCTVVLKPSEVAPLTAFVLAEICAEAGLPAGVFNLVTGYGPTVGEALASHPDVVEAAVYGVPSELTEEDVMAAVVLRAGVRASAMLVTVSFS